MQGKKRYIVIALFLLLGLTTFTFASPREFSKSQKPKEGTSEKIANDTQEKRSYSEALEAVEEAEGNPTLETVETARNEINNVNDATEQQITQLQDRVNVVENTIDVAALVFELERLVSVKETRNDASVKYPTAATEVNKLNEGAVKDNLVTRLKRVETILNDKTKPVYTGITNNQITNENVTLTITDETNVTKTVTLNNEKVDFKNMFEEEGTYVVTLVDEAFLEETITFTIDKTAAKKNAVNANVNGYKNEIKEQYAINGNTVTAYISINEELKYNPTFTFYANGKEVKVVAKEDVVARPSTNANYPYVYEVKLVIDENLVAEDGALTFTVTDIVDKAGNKTADIKKVSNGKVVKLDRTSNRVTFTSIKTSNNVVEGNTYYVKNGDTVTLRIGFREKLGTNAVVKIGGREAELKYVNYFEQQNHHEYTATLTIPENESELTEGKLSFTIENVTDEVGNKGLYYQTNGKTVLETITKDVTTNGKTVIYDRTAAERVYSTVRVNKTEYDENGTKYYYVKNGDSFEFAISFNERLSETPVVTIAGRNVEMKLNEKVLANENKVLYEGTFNIDANEKELKQGTLEIKVSNVKDLVGNESTSTIVTDQTKTSNGRTVVYDCKNPVVSGVNNNNYYKTPITITEVNYIVHNVSPIEEATIDGEPYELGTEYAKEGTHLFVAYDRAGNRLGVNFTIDLTAPALTVKAESVGVDPYYNEISFKLSDNISVDYFVINGNKIDVTNNKYSDANYGNIKKHLVTGENKIELYDVAGHMTEKTFVIAKNTAVVEDNTITLNEDIHIVDETFFNEIDSEGVIINGNGHTVTQYVTDADLFDWYEGKTRPKMGNMFATANGEKVTINNLKFAGTTQYIALGQYRDSTYTNYAFELNNVDVIGLNIVSYSTNPQIAAAVITYGNNTVLNNVNIYNTKMSPLDKYGHKIYDFAGVNYTNTTINGGKIGSIYTWDHTKMTLNNVEVDTIDSTTFYTPNNQGMITIGEGTTVNRINAYNAYDYKRDTGITIKKGAKVKVLDISNIKNGQSITIEDGAIVETVITAEGEMTYAEYAKMMVMNEAELAHAVNESGTYKLGTNITVSNPQTLVIANGVSFNLDLNEFTLTNKVVGGAAVENNGTLTINGNGSIINGTNSTKASHTIVNNGTLVIESGNIGTDTTAGAAVKNFGKTTINGGTFASKQEKVKADGLCAYVFINEAGTMTINNATVDGKTHGLFAANGGELIVNGGDYTLDGNNGLGCYVAYSNGKGKVFLNKGTIKTNKPRNNHYFFVYAGEKNYFDGQATNTGWVVADEAKIYLDGVKLPY